MSSDEIIVGAISSIGGVARYGLVRRLTAPAMNLSDQLLDTLLPLASHLHAVEDESRLRQLMLGGTRAALGAYLLGGVSLALLAQPFLRSWAGHQYVAQAGLAPLLVASGMFQAAMAPAENLLAGMRKLRVPVMASIAGALLKVGLAVGLGLQFGVIGVAIGTVTAGAFTLAPVIRRGASEVGVAWSALIRQSLVPVGLAAGVAVAIVFGARQVIGDGTLLAVLADGAIGSAAFLAAYLLAPPSSLEREMLGRLLKLLRRHRKGAEGSTRQGIVSEET